VPEDWVQRLDFETLEKVGNEYISNELLKRSNDLVWRLKLNGEQWLYVYVMLEFQSSNDRWMALRLMTYIGLLYQDLVKAGQLTEYQKLPPVFQTAIFGRRYPQTRLL
jgi:predicted transposase YdaD